MMPQTRQLSSQAGSSRVSDRLAPAFQGTGLSESHLRQNAIQWTFSSNTPICAHALACGILACLCTRLSCLPSCCMSVSGQCNPFFDYMYNRGLLGDGGRAAKNRPGRSTTPGRRDEETCNFKLERTGVEIAQENARDADLVDLRFWRQRDAVPGLRFLPSSNC